MQENKERWFQLAELAAAEENPAKLYGLIKEINELLEKKQQRFTNLPLEKQSE
ncbi:MAG TPA: hypothetical protein VK763_07365 [Terriglobales bacterium]|nr:hypothetical protein [Terriglobales bacterium]